MKFHRDRTAIRSELETIEQYEHAARDGVLRRVPVSVTRTRERQGAWRLLSASQIKYSHEDAREPLQVSGFTIEPRELVLDELTRHRTTFQLFMPIDDSLLVAVGPGSDELGALPDPDRVELVPVRPGEAIHLDAQTWHTLPFAICGPTQCLTVMHRDSLDAYHDVRDLPAHGWFGVLAC